VYYVNIWQEPGWSFQFGVLKNWVSPVPIYSENTEENNEQKFASLLSLW
jgi:hypothetical protein